MKRLSTSVKAIALATLLAATPGLVLAGGYHHNYKGDMKGEACPQPLMLMDGFYVGAGIGFEAYRVRQSYNEVFGTTSLLNANPAFGMQGVNGGIFGGYGMYFDHVYYLGLEVHGNFGDMNTSSGFNTDLPTNSRSTVKAETTWGVALLPGYKINDSTLFYLRVGYKQAELKATQSLTVGGSTGSASTTKWTNGVSYGAGLESTFWPNWSVRGEYTHTEYDGFSTGGITGVTTLTGAALTTAGSSYFPSDNQFMLSVIYHFAF